MASDINRITKALRRHHPAMSRTVAKTEAARMCRQGARDFHRFGEFDFAPWRGESGFPAHPRAAQYPAA